MQIVKPRSSRTKILIVIGVFLVAVVGGAGAYALLGHRNDAAPTTASEKTYDAKTFNSDPDVPAATNDPSQNAVASDKDGSSSAATPAAGTTPDTPSGAFISNDAVTLSGDRAAVNSVCATTPGASCVISFTKDGTTRSLPAQTTDSTGHASWNWNAGDASLGLSTGTWTVSATATIGNKTSSAQYPITMKVTAS